MLGLDRTFKAIADPSRRAILSALRQGPLNAGEIAAALAIAPNALSFHLRVLREADLVSDIRQGQFIQYTLNTSVLDDLIRFLLDRFGKSGPNVFASHENASAAGESGPAEVRE